MSVVRLLARPLLATGFIAAGVDRLRDADQTAEQLRPTLNRVGGMVPSASAVSGNPQLVAKVLGATQVGAGALLALGKLPRLSGVLLAGTAVLNAVVEYKNADTDTPDERKARRAALLKNLSLIGAVLLVAVDTNGRPGLAWRAGHLADDTRRSVSSLGRDAGRKSRAVKKDAAKQLKKANRTVRTTTAGIVGS
ncbi:DoxX family protein [Arthrobacter sp. ATA002]|uniref:DoxX family protein n=1 Tax=Arthrobacter sp. ATA002 TaxID=2991715 RepID=UPI0022A6A2ED|nr:DoxX family protein [Arthrobacter sp. ATA002]WAP52773.1 DoxX family protein [Arthrobacter sp. ATA002]